MSSDNSPSVAIPAHLQNHPSRYELQVALLLCVYFDSKIAFIDVADSHTPDILVEKHNRLWEIKTVSGSSKNTIHHTMSKAKNQSENVVIAIKNTKLYQNQIIGRIKIELKKRRDIKRLILINSKDEILVIKGKV